MSVLYVYALVRGIKVFVFVMCVVCQREREREIEGKGEVVWESYVFQMLDTKAESKNFQKSWQNYYLLQIAEN